MRYRRWQDAQLSLLGRVILYKVVKEVFNKDYTEDGIKYTKYNKPYFDKNSVKFSISHSGEIAVCAVCDHSEIGIDVELISKIDIDDFKTQMTSNEWNKIMNSINKNNAFFDYWTQKEAVIKGYGQGLTIPLTSFEITDNKTMILEEEFFLKEIFISKKYKCHISSNSSIDKVSVKKINIKSII
jgi:4'-phosphopantetheinyl transferase